MEIEEAKAKKRAYYQANKERIKAYAHNYRKATASGSSWVKHTIYALYDGDEFLDLGTKFYLAEKFGFKPTYIAFLGTPHARKYFEEKGGKGLTAIKVEDDDE